MYFACILQALLRDILRRMKKDKQQAVSDPSPKGADLEKVEVWLRSGSKRRLETIALQDNRSANKQAVHYIEIGMDGIDLREMARKVENMELMLAELLRRSEKE